MKKTLIGLMIAATFYACAAGKNEPTQNPDIQAGLELVGKSGCPTCHKVDELSTGPAFKRIAEKYPSNAENFENLALKVIKGGSGNWGQIPMIQHPDITQENATLMVKYILSLKN